MHRCVRPILLALLVVLALFSACAKAPQPARQIVVNATCDNGYFNGTICHHCASNERVGADERCHALCIGFFCDGRPAQQQLCKGQRCLPDTFCYQGQCVGCGIGETLYDDGQCR